MAHVDTLRVDGKLPAFTSVGGYPIIYIDAQGSVICPECANVTGEFCTEVVSGDVYWEGPDLSCDECSKPMASAYGDPESSE